MSFRKVSRTGLPIRWCLPWEDVRTDLRGLIYTPTGCPYKEVAQYWTLREGNREERDVVRSYPEPMHEAEGVEGLLCFLGERLSLDVEL